LSKPIWNKMSWIIYEEYPKPNYLAWIYRIHQFSTGWREILPETFDTAIVVQDGHFELHLERSGFSRRGNKLFSLVMRDPTWFESLQWEAKIPVDHLFTFSTELRSRSYDLLSDAELATVVDEFLSTYHAAHKHGVLMSVLEFEHELLTKYLLNYLDTVRGVFDRKTSELFTALTSSPRATYTRKDKLSEYELLLDINRNATLRNAFAQQPPAELLSNLPTIHPGFSNHLDTHYQNFCWLPYGTDGPTRTKVDLIRSLQNLLRDGEDPALCSTELKAERTRIQSEQEALHRQISTDEHHRCLFKIAQDSIYLKGLRKDATSYAFYCADGLFRQVARRLNLAISQLRMLLPKEISPAILTKNVDADELNSRINASVYAILDGKQRLLSEALASEYIDTLHSQETIAGEITELAGSCAVAGKVRGLVVIITSAEDMWKMEDGRVLVSYVTDVNLESAMMKAAAIVTDSGGITSHAAIFAREFGITCVVGTKVATKVLSDGDEVEVDAETGIVRILKRALQ
jgi:phosphohistidine swiveling domain-containing protein